MVPIHVWYTIMNRTRIGFIDVEWLRLSVMQPFHQPKIPPSRPDSFPRHLVEMRNLQQQTTLHLPSTAAPGSTHQLPPTHNNNMSSLPMLTQVLWHHQVSTTPIAALVTSNTDHQLRVVLQVPNVVPLVLSKLLLLLQTPKTTLGMTTLRTTLIPKMYSRRWNVRG
jgi:hypothetical protein